MSLMSSTRLSRQDLEAWARHESEDRARGAMITPKVERAVLELTRFAESGPCYLSTSWGKDSVVLLDIALREGFDLPLLWVRPGKDQANPESMVVRDAFLGIYPGARYTEYVDVDLDWYDRAIDIDALGIVGTDRYVTGIRNQESSTRKGRYARWGHSTAKSCAPLSLWTADDVFAYLALYDLPISAVYAMSIGGRLDRAWLRTDRIGGPEGTGRGRAEWERRYFPDIVSATLHPDQLTG